MVLGFIYVVGALSMVGGAMCCAIQRAANQIAHTSRSIGDHVATTLASLQHDFQTTTETLKYQVNTLSNNVAGWIQNADRTLESIRAEVHSTAINIRENVERVTDFVLTGLGPQIKATLVTVQETAKRFDELIEKVAEIGDKSIQVLEVMRIFICLTSGLVSLMLLAILSIFPNILPSVFRNFFYMIFKFVAIILMLMGLGSFFNLTCCQLMGPAYYDTKFTIWVCRITPFALYLTGLLLRDICVLFFLRGEPIILTYTCQKVLKHSILLISIAYWLKISLDDVESRTREPNQSLATLLLVIMYITTGPLIIIRFYLPGLLKDMHSVYKNWTHLAKKQDIAVQRAALQQAR